MDEAPSVLCSGAVVFSLATSAVTKVISSLELCFTRVSLGTMAQ